MGRNVYLCTMNNATHVEVFCTSVWSMDGKEVCFLPPTPLLYYSNSQSFATIYVTHTKQKRKHSSTQNVGGIFFRKVLDAGKLHLLEDLEYQVGAKRQHKHLICIYKHGVQGRARKEVYYNPFTLQIWNRQLEWSRNINFLWQTPLMGNSEFQNSGIILI